MFRLIHSGNALPTSWICDPAAEFQPGQIAQLTIIGNQVMATVSNGMAPLGIIDDIRTKSFYGKSWDETHMVPVVGVIGSGGEMVCPSDQVIFLNNANIVKNSFVCNIDAIVKEINGAIIIAAGTPLNADLDGDGVMDALHVVVRYTYQIPDVPGDDSTAGTGRVTIWYERVFGETDMYESSASYPLNAPLFVNEVGMMTTRKPGTSYPSVAMVSAPPSVISPYLKFLWL